MENTTTQELWVLARDHMKAATVDPEHPFKLVNLGTLGFYPEMRTVVLRDFDDHFHFWIYADSRTPKVSQIRKNTNVSIHAYNPKSGLQVRLRGRARLHTSGEKFLLARQEIIQQPNDYNSQYPPGSEKIAATKSDTVYFILIEIVPQEWDILQLGTKGHSRAKYVYLNDQWKGYEVIP